MTWDSTLVLVDIGRPKVLASRQRPDGVARPRALTRSVSEVISQSLK